MWIFAPAASNLSAGMQRGGKSWIETPRLESCRVAHLRAELQSLRFCWTGLWTGLTGGCVGSSMQTGLTGWENRSDRLCKG